MLNPGDNRNRCIPSSLGGVGDGDLTSLEAPRAGRSLQLVKESLLQTEIHDGICLGITKEYLRRRRDVSGDSRARAPLDRQLERYALKESIARVRAVAVANSIELTSKGYTEEMLARDQSQTWSKLKGTLALTAVSMTVMVASRYVGDALVRAMGPDSSVVLGNPEGASLIETLVSRSDPSCVFAFLFFACLGEENLLRKMPLEMLNKAVEKGSKVAKSYAPLVGLATSASFALAHNLAFGDVATGIEIVPGLSFRTDALPLQQFILGVGMWQIASRYGTHFAVLGHFINNSVFLAVMCLS